VTIADIVLGFTRTGGRCLWISTS